MTPTAEVPGAAAPGTAIATTEEPATLAPIESEPVAQKIPLVNIGDYVRLLINKAGTVRAALGIVTGTGSTVPGAPTGENGEPLLTVVYLDSLDRRTLSSASWPAAFQRVGPVHHETSPAAESGVTYSDVIPMDVSGAVSLAAIELPDVSEAAAAEIQRKEAMGVGRGPVPDRDIAFQTSTATGVSEEAAIPGTPLPTEANPNPVVHTPTPQWPPTTAKIGAPLTPERRAQLAQGQTAGVAAASGAVPAQTVGPTPEDAQKASAAAPATTAAAHGIVGGLAPAGSTKETPA